MGGHRMRVGTLAWCAHRSVVSSGGRDRLILNRDVRAPNDFYAELRGHKSEVRGVAVGTLAATTSLTIYHRPNEIIPDTLTTAQEGAIRVSLRYPLPPITYWNRKRATKRASRSL